MAYKIPVYGRRDYETEGETPDRKRAAAIEQALRAEIHALGVADMVGRSTGRATSPQQQQIEQIQAKAQFDAQNFEKRYTAKQKAEISKWQHIKNSIDSDASYTDEEKASIKKLADMSILGVKPSDLPRMSPYPQGQDIGQSWIDPATKALMTRENSGNQRHAILWKDTPEGISMKMQHEREQAKDKYRQELAKEVLRGEDSQGNPTERRRNAREIEEIMNIAYPSAIADKPTPGAPMKPTSSGGGVPVPPAPVQSQGSFEESQAKMGADEGNPEVKEMARQIVKDAIANPEKLRDEAFARQVRQARAILRGF